MSDETITIPKEAAQRVFDALVSSLDFGSGFLETDDVTALRELAIAIGVDPNVGTPDEFKSQYRHAYEPETDRRLAARQLGAILMPGQPNPTGKPFNAGDIDETAMPDFQPCKVGAWKRPCNKPENDPIHQPAEMGA